RVGERRRILLFEKIARITEGNAGTPVLPLPAERQFAHAVLEILAGRCECEVQVFDGALVTVVAQARIDGTECRSGAEKRIGVVVATVDVACRQRRETVAGAVREVETHIQRADRGVRTGAELARAVTAAARMR